MGNPPVGKSPKGFYKGSQRIPQLAGNVKCPELQHQGDMTSTRSDARIPWEYVTSTRSGVEIIADLGQVLGPSRQLLGDTAKSNGVLCFELRGAEGDAGTFWGTGNWFWRNVGVGIRIPAIWQKSPQLKNWKFLSLYVTRGTQGHRGVFS